jgi:hypothetical protein
MRAELTGQIGYEKNELGKKPGGSRRNGVRSASGVANFSKSP